MNFKGLIEGLLPTREAPSASDKTSGDVVLATGVVRLTLRRSERARRLRMRFEPPCDFELVVPRGMSTASARRRLPDFTAWMEKVHGRALERARENPLTGLPATLEHGSSVLFRGSDATVLLGAGENRAVDGPVIQIRLAPGPESTMDERRAAFEAVAKATVRRRIGEVLGLVVPLAKRAPKGWRLSGARTRWGSCSSRGTLSFSWRLVFLPDELLVAVVCHELAHLVEFNHSEAFWREVANLDADWREHRRALKLWPMGSLPL